MNVCVHGCLRVFVSVRVSLSVRAFRVALLHVCGFSGLCDRQIIWNNPGVSKNVMFFIS